MKVINWLLRPFRGVTLIECMVVVAIIAILAAMLLPAIARVKERQQWQKNHPGEVYHYNSARVGKAAVAEQNSIRVINAEIRSDDGKVVIHNFTGTINQ